MSILQESASGTVAVRPVADLRTEAVLRSILQSIEDGVLLTDLQNGILACNRRFGEMFALDPQTVVDMDVRDLRDRLSERVPEPITYLRSVETVLREPERRHEGEVVLGAGVDTVLRRLVTPVHDPDGRLIGQLWTYADVTEAHQRRRNSEMMRGISMLADPDPGVNLRRICEAITAHFGAASQINILEGDFLRFHLHAGDLGPAAALPGIPKMDTYCGYTLAAQSTLVVQDAAKDPLYAGLLPASVGFCRYLGVPVRDEEGHPIGTLCIIDQQMDRTLTPIDIELMEMVAMRASAELARERYLAERIAEKDRQFARKRRELEETRHVLGTMNDSFALLFRVRDAGELLRELTGLLRDVLGYAASAVFLRRPGESGYLLAACPFGSREPSLVTADVIDFPVLASCGASSDALGVEFVETTGTSTGTLLGLPYAAVACLPPGEWGEAIVVLGRATPPPEGSARHAVGLSAIMDGVRLVLAAHALNDGIRQKNRALTEAQEKALRSEKLAVVGTLAASTAHDIRNITASLSMLAAEGDDPAASLASVREQLDRFNVLAHRLLGYARPGQTQNHPIDVFELLDRVLSLTAGGMRVSRVVPTLVVEEPLPTVMGDEQGLQHLLVNVVLNAVQAMDRTGGTLRLEARACSFGLEIRVVDDGPGIPEAIASRLFEPFASSRPQGFGLGLFSAKRIAEAHGGAIAALENPDGGTTILIRLPAAGEAR